MSTQEEWQLGEDAKAVMSNPAWKHAWSSYVTILTNLLANADTPEDKAREVRALLIAAHKSKGHLERLMAEGNMAGQQIRLEESRRTLKQRVRSAF